MANRVMTVNAGTTAAITQCPDHNSWTAKKPMASR